MTLSGAELTAVSTESGGAPAARAYMYSPAGVITHEGAFCASAVRLQSVRQSSFLHGCNQRRSVF